MRLEFERTESNIGTSMVVDHVISFTRGGWAATTFGSKLGGIDWVCGIKPEHVRVELLLRERLVCIIGGTLGCTSRLTSFHTLSTRTMPFRPLPICAKPPLSLKLSISSKVSRTLSHQSWVMELPPGPIISLELAKVTPFWT